MLFRSLLKDSEIAKTALDDLEYLEKNVLPEMQPALPQDFNVQFTGSEIAEDIQ